MGQFSSGSWIIGLGLYFFIMFVFVFSVVNASNELGIQTNAYARDPGFQTIQNDPTQQGNACSGTPLYLCEEIADGQVGSQSLCESFAGCTWQNATSICTGIITETCKEQTDKGRCNALWCTWTDYTSTGAASTSQIQSFDWSAVKDTIGFLSGFGGDGISLGIPGTFRWIFAFLFFWIPGFALLWSIYMAIPLIH